MNLFSLAVFTVCVNRGKSKKKEHNIFSHNDQGQAFIPTKATAMSRLYPESQFTAE